MFNLATASVLVSSFVNLFVCSTIAGDEVACNVEFKSWTSESVCLALLYNSWPNSSLV